MKTKEMNIVQLISCLILIVGFVVARFVLFDLHGMKQWPVFLFVLCLVISWISYFLNAKITSLATANAYIIGFILSIFLKKNGFDTGGGVTDNMWIIWLISVLVMIAVAAGSEFVRIVFYLNRR